MTGCQKEQPLYVSFKRRCQGGTFPINPIVNTQKKPFIILIMARRNERVLGPPLREWTTDNLGKLPIDASSPIDIRTLRGKNPNGRLVGPVSKSLYNAGVRTVEQFLGTPIDDLCGLPGVTRVHVGLAVEALAQRGDRRVGPAYPLELAISYPKFRMALANNPGDFADYALIDHLEELMAKRDNRPGKYVRRG